MVFLDKDTGWGLLEMGSPEEVLWSGVDREHFQVPFFGFNDFVILYGLIIV